MSDLNKKKKKYHSFFQKRRPSNSPNASEGGSARSNPPKKQHLDAQAQAEDLFKEINISGENLTLEEVAKIAGNQSGSTYAAAANKPAINDKWLVYLQKGRERREPIAKPLFLTFMSSLQNKLWKLPKDEFDKINLDWSDHHLGRGLIACLDENSAAFVKAEAEAFNYEGQTVRAWLKDEFGIITTYQAFLHNEVWGDIRGPQAIGWILEKNGLLDKGKFQVISYQRHKKGVFCRFEASNSLEKAIDEHGHTLRAGICRVVLKKKKVTSHNVVIDAKAVVKNASAEVDNDSKLTTTESH